MNEPYRDISDAERLPASLDADLRTSANPWWEGKPGRQIPEYRRWAFAVIKRKMEDQLAPVVVVRGPRQVGKTTLQEQLIADLLSSEGVEPRRILRVQFDELPSIRGLQEPILAIVRWFQNRVLGKTLNEAAKEGKPAYLFFDEVQNLVDWAPQLKSLVDHQTVRVLVTGSSSLRIEAGRDSLAGRVTTVDLGPLLLREIAGLRLDTHLDPCLPPNGLAPLVERDFWQNLREHGQANAEVRDTAFAAFSERGAYPMVHAHPGTPWPEVADQLNETVIQRAIQHDLRMGSRGIRRDQDLLEEVFRLACRYAGQAPGQGILVAEIQQTSGGNVGANRVSNYLKFLEGAMLLKLVRPMELRLKRRKGSPKLCLCDHGLRAAWLQEVIPLSPSQLYASPELADIAGHLAESVAGYFLNGLPHLDIATFPERATEPEVDFVLTVGETRIPVEVKYRRRIDPQRDTIGLRSFIEKAVYHAPFGVLVTLSDAEPCIDPRIVSLPLSSLLLLR